MTRADKIRQAKRKAKEQVKEYPPGTIGVLADWTGRYTDFTKAMVDVVKPNGTKIVWAYGSLQSTACNNIVDNFEGDWLWIMGDDHVFRPDMLLRLLDHDVDIVVPLCVQKHPPFLPVVHESLEPSGRFNMIDLTKHKEEKLVEVYAAGSAGMLIKRHVLEAMEKPIFEFGRIGQENVGEDLLFCHKAQEAGFKVHCDLSLKLGHLRPITLTSEMKDGKWGVVFDFDEQGAIFLSGEEQENTE